jgi:hypothetical protein
MAPSFPQRLENWIKWAQQDGWHSNHCGSAEFKYRAPQCWEAPEPRAFIDTIDALRVERAWRQLSAEAKLLLKAQYLVPDHPRAVARKLGIHWAEIAPRTACALDMLEQLLT